MIINAKFWKGKCACAIGNMETWLSDSHQVYCKTALSSAEAPARHPNKNSNNQKIESARGTMGRGKRRELLFSFSPSNRAQRALFFFLPQPPYNAKRPLRGREAKQRNLKQSVSQPCFHIRSDVVYMIGWTWASNAVKVICTFECRRNSQEEDQIMLIFISNLLGL